MFPVLQHMPKIKKHPPKYLLRKILLLGFIYFQRTALLNIEIKEKKTQTQSQYGSEYPLGLVTNTLCSSRIAVVSSYCLTSYTAIDQCSWVFLFAIFFFFWGGITFKCEKAILLFQTWLYKWQPCV